MSNIDIISILTITFLGSFGHCIGMCGGIVIAYSGTKLRNTTSNYIQAISHILYSLGRVTTYTLLGAIFGFLGSVVRFENTTNGILFVLLGIGMILIGLSLVGKNNFLLKLENSLSKSFWYKNTFKTLLNSQTNFSFYTLGLLNGLLPCGFVYFFALTAASTSSVFYGALVMFIFGISTIPAMFSFGFFVTLFQKTNFRTIMLKLASITVMLYGIYIIYNGYSFIQNEGQMMKLVNKKLIPRCH